jgi:hypothetical protein
MIPGNDDPHNDAGAADAPAAPASDDKTEITRLRAALQWIADQSDNEDADLDDIYDKANEALGSAADA